MPEKHLTSYMNAPLDSFIHFSFWFCANVTQWILGMTAFIIKIMYSVYKMHLPCTWTFCFKISMSLAIFLICCPNMSIVQPPEGDTIGKKVCSSVSMEQDVPVPLCPWTRAGEKILGQTPLSQNVQGQNEFLFKYIIALKQFSEKWPYFHES